MKMNFRQFIVFVCDLMLCVLFFCTFMQSKPTPNAWGITGFSAFLVILLIIIYIFANFLVNTFLDD